MSKKIECNYGNLEVYDHNDRMIHGSVMGIERNTGVGELDVSELISMDLDTLNEMKEESEKEENQIFEKLKILADSWAEHAGNTKAINRAIAYLSILEIDHTLNEWNVKTKTWPERSSHAGKPHYVIATRSNRVYQMYVRFEYDYSWNSKEATEWEVTWNIMINGYNGSYVDPSYRTKGWSRRRLDGQDRKTFTDKEKAIKYVKGRVKKYDKFFAEINPVVPKEYAENFKFYGTVLPGYMIEGDENND